jgi:ABC-type Fe3+ transport system substrate-binding protein
MKLHLTLFALAAVLAFVLVGCAAPPPTPTPPPPTPTESPQQTLLAAAQKEGALKIYLSLNDKETKPLLEKFNQKYPSIKTEYFRASSADVLEKMLTEAKAGTPPPDVLEMDSVDMLALYNQKILAAYKSPESESFPDGAKHPWGYYTTCYVNAIVIAYNTKLVKPEDAPKSWNDLTNAKWAGKIAVEPEDWALFPFSAKVMGDAASTTFWTKLGEQKLKFIEGHTEVATAVANGEVALSPTVYAHRVEAMKKDGLSIDWVRTDPVYSYLNSVGVSAKAPHPNAARVFVDWILSAEGQAAVAGVGRIPIRAGVKANPASMTEGVKFYYGDPMLITDADKARSQFRSLIGIK